MKAIIRRLRRLETRVVPETFYVNLSIADVLRERYRRRMEASGQPYVEPPRTNESGVPGRYMSIAETLRQRFNRRVENT